MDTTVDDVAGHGGGLGSLLRAHRRTAGLSQRELAESAGVSVAAIRDLEQERTRRPYSRSVDALVVALRLAGDEESMFRRAAAMADRDRHTGPTRPAVDGAPARLGVLGPLMVHRGPHPVLVSRSQQRAVLGRLALSVDAAVPTAELIDLLWADEPPVSAAHRLHTVVSRLRSALHPAGSTPVAVIGRTSAGYRLDLADSQLDLTVFRRTVRAADGLQPGQALDLLESAFMIWRGSPLSDVPQLRDHPLVTAVTEERIAMALRYADLALAAGEAGRCLPLLRELSAAYPLHEPLQARMILTLASEHRQADALSVFIDVRRRLIDDLGVEPSTELRAAHQRVLRQEPAAPARRPRADTPPRLPAHVPAADQSSDGHASGAADAPRPAPRCLPSPVSRLVGRDAELARAHAVVAPRKVGRGGVVVIDGMAGVGKSAFAVALAHRSSAVFTGAQLFVDLKGHSDEAPLSTHKALGVLLGQLLPHRQVPDELPGRLAVWRARMAEQPGIVVLDNAATSAQIKPLLPGLGSSLVLLTSRTRLGPIDGAWSLPLGPLGPGDAVALLRESVGDRVDQEPVAALAVAELCGRLPLALRLVAHRLQQRVHWSVEAMAGQLRAADPPSIAITAEGRSVTGAFAMSYRQLTAPHRRLFRLLGLHPAGDFEVWPAAALADLPHTVARDLLDDLVEANLVLPHTPGRYRLHDLLRDFAASLVRPEERGPAMNRMYEYYLRSARIAIDRLVQFLEPVATVHARVDARLFTDPADQVNWLATQWPTIAALADIAHSGNAHGYACLLPQTIWQYLHHNGHTVEALRLIRQALVSAAATQNTAYTANGHRLLAGSYLRLGDIDACRAHLEQAEVHYWRLADYGKLSSIYRHRSLVAQLTGQVTDSLHHARVAQTLGRRTQDPLYERFAAVYEGYALFLLGDTPGAVRTVRQALRGLETSSNIAMQAQGLTALARMHLFEGRARLAALLLRRTERIHHEIGAQGVVADDRSVLSLTHATLGHDTEALQYHHKALDALLGCSDQFFEPLVLNNLGMALTALGRHTDAIDLHQRALLIAEPTGQRLQQARAHAGIANARRDGRLPDADDARDTAYTLFRSMGLAHRPTLGMLNHPICP